MPSRKKKNKKPESLHKKLSVTKSYFDKCTIVMHKMFRLLELDPQLYDQLTKKQKQELLRIKFEAPKIEIKKGHSVPAAYVRYIQKELHTFLEECYDDYEELNLTYKDYVTIGVPFFVKLDAYKSKPLYSEIKSIQLLLDTFYSFEDKMRGALSRLNLKMQSVLCYLSKFNYRIYGFEWTDWMIDNHSMRYIFYITSYPAVSEKFTYHGTVHTAYIVGASTVNHVGINGYLIPYNKAIVSAADDRLLSIYIQSHALQRIKERIDIIPAGFKNIFLNNSLTTGATIKAYTKQHFFKYFIDDTILAGYMPFTIVGNKLYILSFLPLCHYSVPEGKKLCELLQITKDDMIYLGMDKLSFYVHTDFDSIPILKNALIEAGMWHLTELRNYDIHAPDSPAPVSQSLLTRFFAEKAPKPTSEEVLKEIENLY